MADISTAPFESLRKARLALQKSLEPIVEQHRRTVRPIVEQHRRTVRPIVEQHRRMKEMLKPHTDLVSEIQKQFKSFEKIEEIFVNYRERLKQNFTDIISTIKDPETYDPSEVKLRDETCTMILGMVNFVDDMDNNEFCHLKECTLIGINAHIAKNYHLSLFCIFSVIDGMLSWFYHQKHPCSPHVRMPQKLNEFFQIYAFEHIVGKNKLRSKFEDFFRHRNVIMHGGKNSHFDQNLSTAALLFLGITYISLTMES